MLYAPIQLETRHRPQRALCLLLCLASTAACGKLEKSDSSHSQSTSQVTSTTANASAQNSVSNLTVLAPAELASKIYAAFGPGMTLTTTNNLQVDYLLANQSDFVGSVSSDPTNLYASSFSIDYFLALAGLAQVVGTNYVHALSQPQPLNDCRTAAGAEAILVAMAPTLTASETTTIGGEFTAACQNDILSAISAVVQSYSTALKTTL